MLHQPAGACCDMRQTETKGLGLFAKIDIPEGTLISDEETIKICIGEHAFSAATWENPHFRNGFRDSIAADVEQAMSDLFRYYESDVFQSSLFDRLLNSVSASNSAGGGYTENVELMLKNCLPNETRSPPFWIFFGPTTCTINHSCIPNASFVGLLVGNELNKLRCQVRALKAIEAGSEITISYRIFHLPTAERRTQLREVFRFDCVCDVCTDDSVRMQESNLKLHMLSSQVEVAPDHEIKRRTPWLFFKAAYGLLDQYIELGIKDIRLPRFWENCASVAAYHSDAIRARCCYLYAAKYWEHVQPPRVKTCRVLALFPQNSPEWGHTRMGLSHIGDIHQFLSQEARPPDRLLMVKHMDESYDRILPKEEAEQKQQLEGKAFLAEREKLADEAAKALLAEEETEKGKGKKPTTAPAQKAKKKETKKRKEKKAATYGEVEMEAAGGPAPAAPELRLNTTEEGQEDVAGWEVVGRKKGPQQQA